ncbi:hypothetical protein ACFRGK_21345, partial [Bacillus subtilis]
MLDKIGIPKRLAWGFLGVVLFMMGDGLEQGWLSPFLIENGLTVWSYPCQVDSHKKPKQPVCYGILPEHTGLIF